MIRRKPLAVLVESTKEIRSAKNGGAATSESTLSVAKTKANANARPRILVEIPVGCIRLFFFNAEDILTLAGSIKECGITGGSLVALMYRHLSVGLLGVAAFRPNMSDQSSSVFAAVFWSLSRVTEEEH